MRKEYNEVLVELMGFCYLLHDSVARGREGHAVAEARLGEHAQLRAALLATRPALDAAAHDELALEALVLLHVALEELVAQIILRAPASRGQELTGEPAAAARAIVARRVEHFCLKQFSGVIRLVAAIRANRRRAVDDAAHCY